jgi:hypothetical protein
MRVLIAQLAKGRRKDSRWGKKKSKVGDRNQETFMYETAGG